MSGWLSGLIGVLTGILSGFGVGGGTLLLLWLTLAEGMDQLRAGGVNLLYFVACALPALFGHARNGLLDKKAIQGCVLAGVPACIGAALLAAGLDVGLLRRIFGGFLLIVGARELFSREETKKERINADRPGNLGEDNR